MPARWLASSEKVKVIYKSQTEIFNSNGKDTGKNILPGQKCINK